MTGFGGGSERKKSGPEIGPELKEGLRSERIAAPPLVYVLPCQLAVANTNSVHQPVKRRIVNVLIEMPFAGAKGKSAVPGKPALQAANKRRFCALKFPL